MSQPQIQRSFHSRSIRSRHSFQSILDIFGREIQSLPVSTQALWIERAFEYWRERGFPYPEISNIEITRQFRCLESVAPDHILKHGVATVSTVGLSLANYFHPQMWKVTRHGKSPLSCFSDDNILRKLLKKAIRFWPRRRCWNAQCIRSLARIYHHGRVANFRPAVARAIYNRYSPAGATVLDFSAGYGGRLLGSLTLDRHYIGIDPELNQVRGLRRMTNKLRAMTRGTAEIQLGCAEDLLPTFPSESIDLIFSSPPYFDNEQYSLAQCQSFRRYNAYDHWKSKFLLTAIVESYRLLKPGHCLILNVANFRGHNLVDDVRQISLDKFVFVKTIKMLMNRLPQQRLNRRNLYKWEPILVFRKPS